MGIILLCISLSFLFLYTFAEFANEKSSVVLATSSNSGSLNVSSTPRFRKKRLATENFGMSEFETKQLENKNVVLPSAVSEMTNNNHNEIFASSENLGATESKPSVDRNAAPDNSVPSTPDDGTNKSGDSTKEINKDEKQDMIDSSSANNKGSNDTKSSSEDPSNKEKDTTGSITPPTVPVVIDESNNGDKSNGNSSTGLDTTTLGLVSVIIVIGIILYRIYKRSDANTSGGTNSAIKNTAYTRLPQSEDTRRGGDIEMRGGGGNVHEYDDMAAYENAAGEVWEEWESCDEAPPPAFPNSHSNSNSHIMNSSSSFVAGSTYATPSSNTTTISRIPSPGASLTSLPMTTTAAAASAIRGGSPPATSSTFSNGIQSSSFNKSMSYSGSNNNSRNVSNDRLSSATTTGGFSPPPPPITSTHTTTATMMMNGSNNSLNSINSIGNSNNHAAPNNTAAASAIKPKTANSRQKQDIDLFASIGISAAPKFKEPVSAQINSNLNSNPRSQVSSSTSRVSNVAMVADSSSTTSTGGNNNSWDEDKELDDLIGTDDE